jgi:hypothetical protein
MNNPPYKDYNKPTTSTKLKKIPGDTNKRSKCSDCIRYGCISIIEPEITKDHNVKTTLFQ